MEANGRTTRLRLTVAYTILALFTASFTLDMVSARYEPPVGLQTLMAMVAAWLFGVGPMSGRTR